MKSLKKGFIKSLPIMFGYIFLGCGFGILIENSGYGLIWSLMASIFIYSGTAQFMLVSFLTAPVPLYSVILLTLFMSARHMFYGLSFTERFKRMGKLYPYMIFSLTDETYSLMCFYKDDEKTDDKTLFYISLLNQLYWVLGTVIGSLLGRFIPVDFSGIEFSMTALFVVIFLDRLKTAKSKFPALWGLSAATVCLMLLESQNFLFPALIITVIGISIFIKGGERNA